ncbi:hypothetical protein, partial [Streptomyces sp. YPW6]|uniref:hypothetical protein n=2 Tax=Streptomyces TaxID=1883 RepID=UPI003D7369D0
VRTTRQQQQLFPAANPDRSRVRREAMNDKVKLQVFAVVCFVVSIVCVVVGLRAGDVVYLVLGGLGLLGMAMLVFGVLRKRGAS